MTAGIYSTFIQKLLANELRLDDVRLAILGREYIPNKDADKTYADIEPMVLNHAPLSVTTRVEDIEGVPMFCVFPMDTQVGFVGTYTVGTILYYDHCEKDDKSTLLAYTYEDRGWCCVNGSFTIELNTHQPIVKVVCEAGTQTELYHAYARQQPIRCVSTYRQQPTRSHIISCRQQPVRHCIL
jgi:hypothetical protein